MFCISKLEILTICCMVAWRRQIRRCILGKYEWGRESHGGKRGKTDGFILDHVSYMTPNEFFHTVRLTLSSGSSASWPLSSFSILTPIAAGVSWGCKKICMTFAYEIDHCTAFGPCSTAICLSFGWHQFWQGSKLQVLNVLKNQLSQWLLK